MKKTEPTENTNSRTNRIKQKLSSLTPSHLEIIDETPQHAAHFNNNSLETHLKLIITANSLSGVSRLQQHKMVNELLAEEFEQGLHALTIKIIDEDKINAR